jgi:hypothetical protein
VVSLRLEERAGTRGRAAALAGALILAAACRRGEPAAAAAADQTGTESAAASLVRARYAAGDAVPAGAWTWSAGDGRRYVLVDLQSAVVGLVQARAELWVVADGAPARVGASDVMASAGEFGAYAFEDLTGDGLPDFFGYVADSSGEDYPVFLPGSAGALREEIVLAAPQWRFDLDESHQPTVLRGAAGPCALALWAPEGALDGRPEGWRWLALGRDGRLASPVADQPVCGSGPPALPGGTSRSP